MLTFPKFLLLSSNPKRELILRGLTTLVGIPVVISILHLGSPFVDGMVWVLLTGMLFEWSRLNGKIPPHPLCYVAVFEGMLMTYGPVVPLTFHSTIALVILTAGFAFSHFSCRRYLLFIVGLVYITLSSVILLCLSHQELLLIWLLSLVWATDIGAYIFGSWLGGPKLAPRLSPKKTWSGFIGGCLTALIFGVSLQKILNLPPIMAIPWVPLILILAVASHIGDLLESMLKRYFGFKDSGHIIPGHGGLLDRLDSLLFVVIIYGMLLVFMKL